MDDHSKQHILAHLQKPDAQERIRQSFQRMREEATVTMSGATSLSGFSENQLRDWEERGLLNPLRPKESRGHRLYPFQELDKLALIRELLKAKFAPSDIPHDIDTLWNSISSASEQPSTSSEQQSREEFSQIQIKDAELSINQRIVKARKDLFWHYFVSHVLHISLMLICEEMPNTTAGLVLPLNATIDPGSIKCIEDLSKVGETLVTRLGRSRSSQTLLTEALTFDYATDFRLLPLVVMTDDQPEETPGDNTLIFLERRSKRLILTAPMVETIQRLLKPLYENVQHVRSSFQLGMNDALISSTDLQSNANYGDIILSGLAEMIIHLGQTKEGRPRWRFCCILLPKDSMSPLHQRSLVVRAQSKDAPYKLGITTVTPADAASSLSIRSLQSGHVVYLQKIARDDTSIPFRKEEGPIRSAIAIPIGGEDGLAIAVLYVVSDETAAFSESDQRVLRITCRMAEELLKVYFVRRQTTQKLMDIIEKPALVDSLFINFNSANDFNRDVEKILGTIQTEMMERPIEDSSQVVTNGDTEAVSREVAERYTSFISVDVDKSSSLANKYGDRVARNLTREVGLAIKVYFNAHVKEQGDIYHIYADRFYIILKDVSLERAQKIAVRLKQELTRTYKLDALQTSIDQSPRPESMLELSDTTVRLGITSYSYQKFKELLYQKSSEDVVVEVRSVISSALSRSLDIGRHEGGDVVISWDDTRHNFIPVS